MVIKIEIEKAHKSDVEEILKLQKLAYISEAEIYNDYTIPPLLQTIEEIRQEFNSKQFLKVTNNKRIIGSIRAYKKEIGGASCRERV